MAAMDRWIFHLVEKHPDADAPCLAYVDAARERLHERRVQVLEAGRAPTPFTADEIRADVPRAGPSGCRSSEDGATPFLRVSRFVSCDAREPCSNGRGSRSTDPARRGRGRSRDLGGTAGARVVPGGRHDD